MPSWSMAVFILVLEDISASELLVLVAGCLIERSCHGLVLALHGKVKNQVGGGLVLDWCPI